MRLKLCCFILLCVGYTFADVLQETNHDDLDPISQTGDDAEENDQSKRFLFDDNANRYAWEKHVQLHRGQKYFLGYRPVRLQYLPVAKPLYSYHRRPMRIQGYHRNNLRQQSGPLLSLVPPKVHPTYKTLPANVPASVPQKLWEMQGWDVKPVYGPPGFSPSNPDPSPSIPPTIEPSVPIVPPVVQPTPVQPIVPSSVPPVVPTNIPAYPNVNVLPQPAVTAVHFLPKPVVPVPTQPGLALPAPFPPPFPLPTPVLPAPQPPFLPLPTSVPINPIQPPVLIQKPLIPINFIPGKHFPIPDLGVLPLGAHIPVPVQSPNIVPKQVLVQQPHLIQKHHQFVIQQQPPIPVVHPEVVQKVPAVHLEGGFTPIQHNLAHHHHLVNIQPNSILPTQVNHVQATPSVVQHSVPPNILHQFQSNLIPQPNVVQHATPNVFHQIQPNIIPQPPIFHQLPQATPSTHIQPSENPSSEPPFPTDQSGVVQQEPHNYFYFARRLPNYNNNNINSQLDFGQQQEAQPQINYDQSFQQPSQQQEQENQGFFQPGNTDLQIPEYLPQHPHLKNGQQQEYQGDYEQGKKR